MGDDLPLQEEKALKKPERLLVESSLSLSLSLNSEQPSVLSERASGITSESERERLLRVLESCDRAL